MDGTAIEMGLQRSCGTVMKIGDAACFLGFCDGLQTRGPCRASVAFSWFLLAHGVRAEILLITRRRRRTPHRTSHRYTLNAAPHRIKGRIHHTEHRFTSHRTSYCVSPLQGYSSLHHHSSSPCCADLWPQDGVAHIPLPYMHHQTHRLNHPAHATVTTLTGACSCSMAQTLRRP